MKQIMQPISVVVPTLNEVGNIPLLFERIHASLAHADIPYEVIVVDDHSTDGTQDAVRSADAKYNAHLLMKQGKPGKAFSLLEGFAAAENELVCMIDGDLQYPPEAIKLMYHKLQYCEADIVVTERVEHKTSFMRRLSSYIFSLFFVRLLFGIQYDTQSGLKLFRKSILKTISVDPSPWTFDLEFIVRALEQNYVIVRQEIYFSERNAGVPKVHLLRATMEIASKSLKLWRNTSTRRVKGHYRYLQRTMNLLVAVLGATFLITSMGASRASALDLTPTGVYKAVQSAVEPSSPAPATSDKHPSTTNQTKTPAAQSSNAATSQSAPAATNDTSPTSTATAATKTATPETGSDANTANSLTGSQGKNQKYYPTSKLSNSKTESLLRLALQVTAVGAALLLVGGLMVGTKKLLPRLHRQTVRA